MTVETKIEAQGDVLCIRITGKLTAADYEHFVPAVDRHIAARERVHFLVELHDFHGWTAGALWHDLKFGIQHFHRIDRIAIVGEKPWQKGLAMFCRPFTMARIRYFSADQGAAARAWLGEGLGRAPSGHVYDLGSAPPALAELLRAMDGRDGVAREAARKQIVTLGATAVPHLIQAAQGGHWQLRLEATRALAAIGEPNSAEALARQFDDSSEIGWAAAEGLKTMGVPGARAVLQQLVQHPGSHGVRVAALHALREQQAAQIRAATAPVIAALEDSAPASEAPVAAFAALQKLA
ncbi:MAG: STAS/SEC14 domain-containing protein [Planctomycetes bacterium]|nr:STAS/SEC14 domain-containing protein [Planctomycetota bacterium]